MKQVKLKIRGYVQGIFYRAEARDEAQRLGLTGWVKNDMDGSVSALAQGPEESLKKFINWCKKGPSGARVEDVIVEWHNVKEHCEGFKVRY